MDDRFGVRLRSEQDMAKGLAILEERVKVARNG